MNTPPHPRLQVHFVSDEIYALSIFTGEHAGTPFVSAYTVAHGSDTIDPKGMPCWDRSHWRPASAVAC